GLRITGRIDSTVKVVRLCVNHGDVTAEPLFIEVCRSNYPAVVPPAILVEGALELVARGVVLKLAQFFVSCWLWDRMIFAGRSQFQSKWNGERLNPLVMSDGGREHLAGFRFRFGAYGMLDTCQRQQLAGVGRVEEVLCKKSGLLS